MSSRVRRTLVVGRPSTSPTFFEVELGLIGLHACGARTNAPGCSEVDRRGWHVADAIHNSGAVVRHHDLLDWVAPPLHSQPCRVRRKPLSRVLFALVSWGRRCCTDAIPDTAQQTTLNEPSHLVGLSPHDPPLTRGTQSPLGHRQCDESRDSLIK